MDNLIVLLIAFVIVLFFVSFVVVYKYSSWNTKNKKSVISFGKMIVNTICPSNSSKKLQSFVKFMNTNKPKQYSLKGNKYE